MVLIKPRASIPQDRSNQDLVRRGLPGHPFTSLYVEDLKGNARKSSTDPKQSHPSRPCVSLFSDTGAAGLARMERNSFGASSGNILNRIPGDYGTDAGNGAQVTDVRAQSTRSRYRPRRATTVIGIAARSTSVPRGRVNGV